MIETQGLSDLQGGLLDSWRGGKPFMRLKIYSLHTEFGSVESDVTDSIAFGIFSIQTSLHEPDFGFLPYLSPHTSPWCPTLFPWSKSLDQSCVAEKW